MKIYGKDVESFFYVRKFELSGSILLQQFVKSAIFYDSLL